jgi:hypothetical protein
MTLVDLDREADTEACFRDPEVAALAGLVAAGGFDDDAALDAAGAGVGTTDSLVVMVEVVAFFLVALGRGFA